MYPQQEALGQAWEPCAAWPMKSHSTIGLMKAFVLLLENSTGLSDSAAVKPRSWHNPIREKLSAAMTACSWNPSRYLLGRLQMVWDMALRHGKHPAARLKDCSKNGSGSWTRS